MKPQAFHVTVFGMKIYNLDAEFEKYLKAWMSKHADAYGNNMDRLEEMVPDVYMEFLGMPLAILGGARDADVYEISFAAPVSEKSELTFTFAQAPADGVNSDYDRSEADFSLSVRKLQKENAAFAVDGSVRDFALYAVNGNFEQVRKQGGDGSTVICSLYNPSWFSSRGYIARRRVGFAIN